MAPTLPTAEEVAAAQRRRAQLPSLFQPATVPLQPEVRRAGPATTAMSCGASKPAAATAPSPYGASIPPAATPYRAAGPSTMPAHAPAQPHQQPVYAAAGAAPPQQPATNSNALIVSSRQRGNPVLKAIKAVPWAYGPTTADFGIAEAACALFLSLRYHLLHPNYLLARLRELKETAPLRLVLLLVDSEAPEKPILQVCV